MKKKQIIYMMCATALLSSCHIYKAYDRPDTITADGIYRNFSFVSSGNSFDRKSCAAVDRKRTLSFVRL